jgi:hypothetical protein
MQNTITRLNGKQSTYYLISSWRLHLPLAFQTFFLIFYRTVLIQDPAHMNNFIFPAMALRDILCLARVCLLV